MAQPLRQETLPESLMGSGRSIGWVVASWLGGSLAMSLLHLAPAIALEPAIAPTAETFPQTRPDDDRLAEPLPLTCSVTQPQATDRDIDQTQATLPSLWLTRDLFGGKLIKTWHVYHNEDPIAPSVEAIVNPQPWQTLGYLQQYTFVKAMGRAAHSDGYDLTICDDRLRVLAVYRCGSGAANPDKADDLSGLFDDDPGCQLSLPGGLSVRLRLF